jgi:hypothetical protein
MLKLFDEVHKPSNFKINRSATMMSIFSSFAILRPTIHFLLSGSIAISHNQIYSEEATTLIKVLSML